jgi:hypothetical protein
VDDLVEATNSYRSLKIRATKQTQELEAWSSKMEVMKRENGKVLKENSLLHMELIKKDEACDEKLRAAAAEARELENVVAELGFWKRQHVEKYATLEREYEACKEKLNDVITGTYAFSKVPGEDIKARMELSEALKNAVAAGPGGAAERGRAEELVAVADERAAALQRRLVESEAEMQRMQSEVDAARRAVAAREGEVRRLNGMLDNATDVDVLALRELSENKDALIESLSAQAEDLTRRIIELENGTKDEKAELAEAVRAVALEEKKEGGGEALADALAQAEALRRELALVAAARDEARATVERLEADAAKPPAAEAPAPPAPPAASPPPAPPAAPASPAASAPGGDADRLASSEAARAAAELKAVEASAEARRAQSLLMDAMRELERVRAFAEQSEEQRGEVIAAAKSAAEVLARHEAASGEQAAALETLDRRARAAEAGDAARGPHAHGGCGGARTDPAGASPRVRGEGARGRRRRRRHRAGLARRRRARRGCRQTGARARGGARRAQRRAGSRRVLRVSPGRR